MTVKEQLELQKRVRRHQVSLHPFELKRREKLLRDANGLVGRLAQRAAIFASGDHTQYRRTIEAIRNASARTERRAKDYYGE